MLRKMPAKIENLGKHPLPGEQFKPHKWKYLQDYTRTPKAVEKEKLLNTEIKFYWEALRERHNLAK